MTVAAEGRALRGRSRHVDLWLPAANGAVAEQVAQPPAVVDRGWQRAERRPHSA